MTDYLNTILVGDVREKLRELPDGIAQTCVTSPPYWGLRDYGVAGQIGLEPTPQEYVATMVDVFREVRRVLKGDGTLWLNIGDSYAGSWGAQGREGALADRSIISARQIEAHPKKASRTGSIPHGSNLKAKDLVGIPWRLAFALQDDGWWLRSDIIWAKRNCMPESVTDRPTKAHEYLFLLAKSERYFYDLDAIKEPVAVDDWDNGTRVYGGKNKAGANVSHARTTGRLATRAAKNSVSDPQSGARRIIENVAAARASGGAHDNPFGGSRNKRTVWFVATTPFPDAHFAVFPEELIQPCVLAGAPEGGVVLDPFMGAGTTALVAIKASRKFIGVELNPKYAEMARKRIEPELTQLRLA